MSTDDDIQSIEDIGGVGPSKADALREAGYESVEDLKAASQSELADIDGVDRVSASEADGDIRIDLDGVFAESPRRDVGETGDNANVSVWMDAGHAKELASQLIGALPTDS